MSEEEPEPRNQCNIFFIYYHSLLIIQIPPPIINFSNCIYIFHMNLESVKRKIRSKKDMHMLLLVEGVVLPRLQSTLCTGEFLRKVFEGSIWVPDLSNSVHRPVLYPPPLSQLQAEVMNIVKLHCEDHSNDRRDAKYELYQVLQSKQADRDFLLSVLTAIDNQHAILQKHYRPPGKPTRIAQSLMVGDPDGFLRDMLDLPAN